MMYPADCRNLVFFFFFFFFFLFFFGFCNFSSVSGIREIPIGALLDFSSHEGSMASTCLSMSLSDFYSLNSDYTTRLSLLTRNYSGILDSASGAVDLLNNGVVAILGPLRSSEAAFVIEIGANSHVPVVSFSATSPSLSLYKSPYFIRAAQVDSFQVNAIVSIIQKFGWHQVALVYEDTEFGNGIIPFLTDALLDSDIKLSIKSGIPLSAQDSEILTKLNELKSMWTRVFVVHMTSSIGSRLFALADKAGMMSEGFAWIVTDSLSNSVDVLAPIFIDAMEGVLGIRPFIPKSRNLDNFKLRLKRKILSTHPTMITTEPDIFCLWAYDTIWALADAIERAGLGFINSTLLKPNNKHTVINYVSNLGVSTVGPKLVGEILKTRFRGLSGEFNLVGGQLQPCAYEIFNVIGKGARPIGYWSSEHGITRRQGTSITHLKSVIWPGDSTRTPRGWTVPSAGSRTLIIGVPYKAGFPEFVNVTEDPLSNNANFTGFSIDVFRLIWDNLPYKFHYQLKPYINKKGGSSGSYDSVVCQIKAKDKDEGFDAVVGDITIVGNRTRCADFTLPYSDTGVTMLVPIEHNRGRDMWIFLKPLSLDLWLTILIACICVGLSIKVLERRSGSVDFTGSRKKQLGMILLFPVQAIVTPQREMVNKHSSRVVLVIWLFLAFILMQSYTANLSSILTVDQLRPSYPSVKSLRDNGDYLGYQSGSFIEDFLVNELKFERSKIKPYDNISEYDIALSRGSKNGGVSVIFDEIPYIKVFLAKYGTSRYMMAGPIYRTEGLGFAFPIGAPLVAYVSREIIKAIGGKEMTKLEKKYFGTWKEKDINISSKSPGLSTSNFGGLFIITATATLLAIIVSEVRIWQRSLKKCVSSSPGLDMVDQTPQPSDESQHPQNENGTIELVRVVDSIANTDTNNIINHLHDESPEHHSMSDL